MFSVVLISLTQSPQEYTRVQTWRSDIMPIRIRVDALRSFILLDLELSERLAHVGLQILDACEEVHDSICSRTNQHSEPEAVVRILEQLTHREIHRHEAPVL